MKLFKFLEDKINGIGYSKIDSVCTLCTTYLYVYNIDCGFERMIFIVAKPQAFKGVFFYTNS